MTELTIERALQQGIEAHKAGHIQEADRLYTAIVKAQPEHPDANHNLGVLAVGVGKPEQALPFFKTALETNPAQAQFWLSYIDALITLGKLADAKTALDQATIKGASDDGFDKLEQRLNEACEEPVVARKLSARSQPKQRNILDSLKLDQAISLAKKKVQEGHPEEAQHIYRDILAKFPKNKRAARAIRSSSITSKKKKASIQDPPHEDMQAIMQLYTAGQLNKALLQAETLLKKHCNSHVLLNLQGAILTSLKRYELALRVYKKALTIKPDYAEAHFNIGNTLQRKGLLDEAVAAYSAALRTQPDFAEAHNNMGNTFYEQGNLRKATQAYSKSLNIKPNNAKAHNNMGNALKDQGKLDLAIQAYNRALNLNPHYADAQYNKGNILLHQGKLYEAVAAYEAAHTIDHSHSSAYVQKTYLQRMMCDWRETNEVSNNIANLGVSGEPVAPFATLSMEDAPSRHKLRSEMYAQQRFPYKNTLAQKKRCTKPKRLRLGYFSADFHDHATMHLMSQVFANHNPKEFELYAYSYGPDSHDEMRKSLLSNVDVFQNIADMSDIEVVELSRNDHLDLAIDLKGYTKGQRLGPFAYGLAPVQISYLGYPGTLGTSFIDYIIADPVIIPETHRKYYSENIIYLPNTYQPTDNNRIISDNSLTRAEMHLPETGFVFCCFNNSYKISHREFDIWIRLLKSVEGSVLWLLKTNRWAEHNLQREAEVRGISADRLVFADKMPQAQHLARHQLADLFLDTFHYNAHTTASDALWAGLPIVTKIGNSFSARVAASLLNAVGLPELITNTEADYESTALKLAQNPNRLRQFKNKLKDHRLIFPLFNSELYTKHLENGYQQAYQNYLKGNSPRDIFVDL